MVATKKKKLTKKEIKLALALQLAKLADGRVQPPNNRFGICHNLERFMQDLKCGAWSYCMVPEYAKGWPKHSGDDSYPVDDRWSAKNKWAGKSGSARKELCLYIAKKLRSEVRQGKFNIRQRTA